MHARKYSWILASIVCVVFAIPSLGEEAAWPPETAEIWVRPAISFPADPVWGHADGLRVGLWPLTGPRGLLRIYAPYLGHRDDRMINCIAVEPILAGSGLRSFSELELSLLDDEPGLRMWSADTPEDPSPGDPAMPARGTVTREGDVEILTVYVFVEPYRSGARVYLRLRFRSDRPYEVSIAAFTQRGSAELAACIVTATMGNFARLRTLHLRNSTTSASELWPTYDGGDFAPRICFPLDELRTSPDGDALFIATPDEANPVDVQYAPHTFIGWKYYGDVATQSWRCEDPSPRLRGCVNGRVVYWASNSPIPGGIAIENFELIAPFHEGSEFRFGVTPGFYEPPPPTQPLAKP